MIGKECCKAMNNVHSGSHHFSSLFFMLFFFLHWFLLGPCLVSLRPWQQSGSNWLPRTPGQQRLPLHGWAVTRTPPCSWLRAAHCHPKVHFIGLRWATAQLNQHLGKAAAHSDNEAWSEIVVTSQSHKAVLGVLSSFWSATGSLLPSCPDLLENILSSRYDQSFVTMLVHCTGIFWILSNLKCMCLSLLLMTENRRSEITAVWKGGPHAYVCAHFPSTSIPSGLNLRVVTRTTLP